MWSLRGIYRVAATYKCHVSSTRTPMWWQHCIVHCCHPISTPEPLLPRYTMGWLRLVESIELQVSFAKEPYKRDAILHQRPIILSILLTVATPYP